MPGIVVGVDGSEHSQLALEWAMKEAALRHAPLTVLTVHQVAGSYWSGTPTIYPADQPEVEKVREAAEAAAQEAAGRLAAQPASVITRAVSGLPAMELINASHDADLVVVGSRGGGGFGSLLMGSVSNQVVNHAACPVVVVRSQR
ncbi:MAG TPA: universal stress protein [Streptosporangiaceae bacterium]|nr:universal stress protein [Streptosporangiaceae bacterium]